MSKTLLLCAFLAAAGAAGCASSPSEPQTARHARSAATDPSCVQASRIPSNTCNAPGSSWSRTDLDRTGQNNPADALSQLDPRVQVHHP
jgi:hypothetical protein